MTDCPPLLEFECNGGMHHTGACNVTYAFHVHSKCLAHRTVWCKRMHGPCVCGWPHRPAVSLLQASAPLRSTPATLQTVPCPKINPITPYTCICHAQPHTQYQTHAESHARSLTINTNPPCRYSRTRRACLHRPSIMTTMDMWRSKSGRLLTKPPAQPHPPSPQNYAGASSPEGSPESRQPGPSVPPHPSSSSSSSSS